VGKNTAEVDGAAVVSDTQPVLDLYSKLFVVILNNTNPVAGLFIESRWVVVIRGGKKPLFVDKTSNCAEGFTFAMDTPMPTCACVTNVVINKKERKRCFIKKILLACLYFLWLSFTLCCFLALLKQVYRFAVMNQIIKWSNQSNKLIPKATNR
jgi:hypothetical protein